MAPPKPERDNLLKRLRMIHARLEPVFGQASAALFQQVDRMGTASKLMKAVEHGTRPAARAAILVESNRFRDELDDVLGRFRTLQALFAQIEDEARDENAILTRLHRDIRVAVIIAFNARVVGSAVRSANGTMESFAQSVHDLLRGAEKDIAALEDIQSRATIKLLKGIGQLAAVGAQVAAMQADHDRIPDLLQALSQSDLAQTAAVTFGAASADVEAALFAALSSLQGGDAISQRLEHAMAAIAFCDSAEVAADAAWTVGQALLRALLSDLLADIAMTRTQIDAMARPFTRAETTLRSLTQSGLIESATAAGEALANNAAAALTAHSLTLTAQLRQMSAEYDDKVEAASRLAEIEDQILLLGINATLMSRGKGADGHAMAEIARQLREISQAIVDSTMQLLAKCMTQRSNMQLATKEGTAPDISGVASDGTTQVDLVAFGNTMAALGALTFEDFPVVLRDITANLQKVTDAVSRLKIEDDPGSGTASFAMHEALQHIRDRYTVQIEREIHDAVLGIAPVGDGRLHDDAGTADLNEMFF